MTWRNYQIAVEGFPPFVAGAVSRGRAMADAFSRYREPYPDITFREFLKRTRVTACAAPTIDGYAYVRRNYGLNVRLGQRVRLKGEGAISGREGEVVYPGESTAHVVVLLDGEQHPSCVHPHSVDLLAEVSA